MGGPHDGKRQRPRPVGLHQKLLAGDLVPGVGPVGIRKRRTLGNPGTGRGLLVGGGGRDVDVLPGAACKEADVPLCLLLGEADELTDGIEGPLRCQELSDLPLILHVPHKAPDARRQRNAAPAPVEHRDLHPLFRPLPHTGGGDGSGATDYKYSHDILLFSSPRRNVSVSSTTWQRVARSRCTSPVSRE